MTAIFQSGMYAILAPGPFVFSIIALLFFERIINSKRWLFQSLVTFSVFFMICGYLMSMNFDTSPPLLKLEQQVLIIEILFFFVALWYSRLLEPIVKKNSLQRIDGIIKIIAPAIIGLKVGVILMSASGPIIGTFLIGNEANDQFSLGIILEMYAGYLMVSLIAIIISSTTYPKLHKITWWKYFNKVFGIIIFALSLVTIIGLLQ